MTTHLGTGQRRALASLTAQLALHAVLLLPIARVVFHAVDQLQRHALALRSPLRRRKRGVPRPRDHHRALHRPVQLFPHSVAKRDWLANGGMPPSESSAVSPPSSPSTLAPSSGKGGGYFGFIGHDGAHVGPGAPSTHPHQSARERHLRACRAAHAHLARYHASDRHSGEPHSLPRAARPSRKGPQKFGAWSEWCSGSRGRACVLRNVDHVTRQQRRCLVMQNLASPPSPALGF
jgi:hypothetical protein